MKPPGQEWNAVMTIGYSIQVGATEEGALTRIITNARNNSFNCFYNVRVLLECYNCY